MGKDSTMRAHPEGSGNLLLDTDTDTLKMADDRSTILS